MERIDWARITELRDEIGPEDFAEVADLFLAEVVEAIDALDEASGDATRVEEHMHYLKGAALNLGFTALSNLCQKGESAAASGDPVAVSPDEVRACFKASQTQYDRQFQERFAA